MHHAGMAFGRGTTPRYPCTTLEISHTRIQTMSLPANSPEERDWTLRTSPRCAGRSPPQLGLTWDCRVSRMCNGRSSSKPQQLYPDCIPGRTPFGSIFFVVFPRSRRDGTQTHGRKHVRGKSTCSGQREPRADPCSSALQCVPHRLSRGP